MKKYKVTLKTFNASQFVHYAVDGIKKYNFFKNKPVIISDKNIIEQLKTQSYYEIQEI